MPRLRLLVVGSERQERDVARTLDRERERPLMLGAGARDTPGHDLAALGDEVLQALRVLVVDRQRLVGAEAAASAPSTPERASRFLLPSLAGALARPLTRSRCFLHHDSSSSASPTAASSASRSTSPSSDSGRGARSRSGACSSPSRRSMGSSSSASVAGSTASN